MKRVLKIDKFRNIGLDETQQLVLNQSMEKGKMGNLVVLIGANNSGKSNVLDALLKITNGNFEERDITTLSYETSQRIPSLALSTYVGNSEYSYKITNGENPTIVYPFDAKKARAATDANNIELCDVTTNAIRQYKPDEATVSKLKSCRNTFSNEKSTSEQKLNAENELFVILSNLYNRYRQGYSADRYVWNIISQNNRYKLLEKVGTNDKSVLERVSDMYYSELGIKLIPKILKYEQRFITNEDLNTRSSRIENEYFFSKVLSAINVKVEEVRNVYELFSNTKTRGCLKNFESKVNKKLRAVARDFNNLYYVEDGTYSFEMSFESDSIFFSIMRNGDAMPLNYQSTGFKWFFNLYFNLLVGSELSAGDIIIMDEPATNLHVQGQYELRKFLKDFAIKNDITIIIATHSPFLIDMDYLDELRVVSNNNNISSISNDFSTIDLDDPDSLKPIKQALTVHNHILTDPDKKVVFVEGITDYNYMIAFKKLFDVDDIVFLPIKGVGDGKSPDIKAKQAEICKRLLQIRKHGPVLMVDGDKAGNAMQTNSKGKSELIVFTLKDVDESFTEIESLFTADDLKKLGLADKNGKPIKHSGESAVFKTYTDIAKTVSQQTIDNFQKVFKYIETL